MGIASKTIILIHRRSIKKFRGKVGIPLDLPRLRYPRGPIRGYAEIGRGGKGEIGREAVGNEIDGTGSSGGVMGKRVCAVLVARVRGNFSIHEEWRMRLGKPRCTHVHARAEPSL